MEKEKPKKLKPVVFIDGKNDFFRQNLFQQNLLLKALKVTTDPKELRQMAGLKSVAEVYRTLDKLSLRKEYHAALARHGVDFDFIVKEYKDIVQNTFKDADRIKALNALLKSLGMDSYSEESESGKTWEELLIAAADEEKKLKSGGELLGAGSSEDDYEVIMPEVPEEEKRKIEEEMEIGKSIYE